MGRGSWAPTLAVVLALSAAPAAVAAVQGYDASQVEGSDGDSSNHLYSEFDVACPAEASRCGYEVRTVDVTATEGPDYWGARDWVQLREAQLAGGQAGRLGFCFPLHGDTEEEGDETFRAEVRETAGDEVLSEGSATATILDDDGDSSPVPHGTPCRNPTPPPPPPPPPPGQACTGLLSRSLFEVGSAVQPVSPITYVLCGTASELGL